MESHQVFLIILSFTFFQLGNSDSQPPSYWHQNPPSREDGRAPIPVVQPSSNWRHSPSYEDGRAPPPGQSQSNWRLSPSYENGRAPPPPGQSQPNWRHSPSYEDGRAPPPGQSQLNWPVPFDRNPPTREVGQAPPPPRGYHVHSLSNLPDPIQERCSLLDGKRRHCVQRSTCFYMYPLGYPINSSSTCPLWNDYGVCCPVEDYNDPQMCHKYDYLEDAIFSDRDHLKDYQSAYDEAVDNFEKIKKSLKKIEITFTAKPEDFHQDMLTNPEKGLSIARDAWILNEASRIMIERNITAGADPKYVSLWGTELEKVCKKRPQCDLSRYRNIDGTCNNVIHPFWGSANTGFIRMGEPDYADGYDKPRMGKYGELPGSRYISLHYAQPRNKPHRDLSHMAMAFGQLIAHDLSRVAIYTGSKSKPISCCTPEALKNPDGLHPACYPIKLLPRDPQYGDLPCMEFVRAVPAQTDNCKLSTTRNPLNQVTHFLDASFLYGPDEDTLHRLRSYEKGLMKSEKTFIGERPPPLNSTRCGDSRAHCFDTGDVRGNQQPPILLLHIIFLKHHNQLAHTLHKINPHWNDEMLFQETRMIVIAQVQHIVFNEFLPLFLDFATRKKFGLLLQSEGYSSNYDSSLKPNVLTEFQAAAFRIGHSLVQEGIHLIDNGRRQRGYEPLREQYFNPRIFHSSSLNLEYLLNGLMSEQSQSPDHYFAESMTRYLFQRSGHPGLDIYAINLQRGRDLGVNGYNVWRERCNLKRATKFDHFHPHISRDGVKNLEEIYKHVDDVDLYTAGVMEIPIEGTILGPTFACITANQFQRLKYGDRFWYERYSKVEQIGFSSAQLQEIRKTTLARIVCDNSRVRSLQPLVLLQPSANNPQVECQVPLIPTPDYNHWRTQKY